MLKINSNCLLSQSPCAPEQEDCHSWKNYIDRSRSWEICVHTTNSHCPVLLSSIGHPIWQHQRHKSKSKTQPKKQSICRNQSPLIIRERWTYIIQLNTFQSKCHLLHGEDPFFQGEDPLFQEEVPLLQGEGLFFQGESPFFQGEDPFYQWKFCKITFLDLDIVEIKLSSEL